MSDTTTVIFDNIEGELEIDDDGGDTITVRFVFESGIRLSLELSHRDAWKIGDALTSAVES